MILYTFVDFYRQKYDIFSFTPSRIELWDKQNKLVAFAIFNHLI